MDNEIKSDSGKKDEENIGSFYMGRVRPPPEPKRLLPPGVLTLIALTALAGIVWYAYPRGAEKYTNMDVPLVKADTAPIKAAPANPGGMEVSHQDSTVFDPLQKNAGKEVEKLLPTPEEPMDKDQAIKTVEEKPQATPSTEPPKLDLQMKDAGNGAEEIVPKAAEVKPPAAVPPAVAPPANTEPVKMASAAPLPNPEPVKTVSAVPPPIAEVKTAPPQKDEDAADTGDDTDNVSGDEAADKPAASSSADKKYEVQLGSYPEMADAKTDWDRFRKKYAQYLGDLKMRLVKVDIPDKGTRYRLQAGAITKDRAHEICEALKPDHGIGCILAKK